MGLFNKLFGSEASPETIKRCVATAGAFATATATATDGTFPELAEGRRDYLTLFTFGGIHVLAQKHSLSVPQAHAVAIATFISHLNYSNEDAAIKAQGCISAAGQDGYASLKAIIHKGIDGFLSWEAAPDNYTAAEFTELLNALSKSTARSA